MQDAVAEGPRSVGTHTTVATAGARGAGSGGDAPGDVRLRPPVSFCWGSFEDNADVATVLMQLTIQ